MKYTLKEKTPEKDQVIVFKSKLSKLPEIGIWSVYGDVVEIYIPANDDSDLPESLDWWMVIPD